MNKDIQARENYIIQSVLFQLRRWQETKGLSNDELSKLAGVSDRSLHLWYKKKVEISIFRLYQLAEAMDLTVTVTLEDKKRLKMISNSVEKRIHSLEQNKKRK